MNTMQTEKFESVFPEAREIFPLHWRECAGWQNKISLGVDEQKYIALEESGKAVCFTLRKSGVLIGYMFVLLTPHLHYKDEVFAYVDAIFVSEAHRNGMAAINFMKFAESQIKKTGASVMTYHIKAHHDYPAIFQRLGYDKVESIYAKCFKETNHGI